MKSTGISRRGFLGAGIAGAGLGAFGRSLAAPAAGRSAGASNRIRVGFVGVGGRGSHLLAVALSHGEVDVTALCDLQPEKLKAAADRVETACGRRPALYREHRKLLEDGKIQAVVSATPCCEHHRIYRNSIDAGKHLYGEKPMCITLQEAEDIVAAQERNSRLKVQIGFQRRSNPRYQEGVKLIREDRVLGDLIDGRSAFNNSWAPPHGLGGKGHWLSRVEKSGDWMIEQAVHSWDVLNWVAGATPISAFGVGHPGLFKSHDPERNVHDDYCAILQFSGGLTVQFSHSWISPEDPAFEGAYDRFTGLLGGIDLGAGRIIYSKRSGRREKERIQTIRPDVTDDTRLSLHSFFDCILKDRKPHSTVYNGRDATLVGLLVRSAVRQGKLVTWKEMLRSQG